MRLSLRHVKEMCEIKVPLTLWTLAMAAAAAAWACIKNDFSNLRVVLQLC